MFSCKKDAEHNLRNNSYSLISTQPVANLDKTGVTFVGSITKAGKEPIIDHGFVWNTNGSPTINDSHISLGEMKDIKDFQAKVTYDLKPDQNYYMKAYIKTDNYIMYGDQVMFNSLGSSLPVIERIEPAEITCYMDQITIYGKNFCSNISDAKITDSWTYYYIESISPDSIVIRMNYINPGTSTFKLSIFDKTIPVSFEAVGLVFESIEPQPAEIGSIVSIKGRNLSNIQTIYDIFYSGGVEIIEKRDTEIKIKIHVLKEGKTTLQIMDTRNTFLLPIDILSPWKAIELPFELPIVSFDKQLTYCNYQDKFYTLINTTIYQLDMQNKTYLPIAMIPEKYFEIRRYCMIENNFYICERYGAFYCYDVTTNILEELPSAPHGNISYPVLSFSIEDKVYLISYDGFDYLSNFFLLEYDSATKIWKQISNVDYIFEYNYSSYYDNIICTATIHKGKAYISANNKIWEFDNQTYSIQEKIMNETGKYSYTYNNKIYIAGSNFIEYDPEINQIKQLPKLSYTIYSIFFWKNFLFAYVNTDANTTNGYLVYEYLVFDLDEL